MAIKKSELYSSLWRSCDELRGGMDASQYKDYVLVMLFMKYVSDRYAGQPDALIEVPEGGSFQDMVALRGDKEIGDKLNKIIAKLAEANDLVGVITLADFNDPDKLGKGKEMVDRLSNLVGIFDNPALNFSKNNAEGDDLLGDAYEYLMRHFATESGKSKGQFYTPAEVSRIMARVIGIDQARSAAQTIFDPTCGSGALLLKAAAQAPGGVTIYGQEMDNATAALARMNMILHDNATAEIRQGNTLSAPEWTEQGKLKTFDYVVANPPFSTKSWSNGIDVDSDLYGRFTYGTPPTKNGDYAFLLHILASMKSTGTGAVILPHGVLFRGNAEAVIRRNLIERRYIKGIIGLPANLFYGTGIPACIIVLDKKEADTRQGIFMIDASRGFAKDGNKNRLRHQDFHRIVDVFTRQLEVPYYSRMVPISEILDDRNDGNLNIPRYIESGDQEQLQDIEAHLRGGLPNADIDRFQAYWEVLPGLRTTLFADGDRPGYSTLKVPLDQLKAIILKHPEFKAYSNRVLGTLSAWVAEHTPMMEAFTQGGHPKELVHVLSEDLLARFQDTPLLSGYDLYQHFMTFWDATMQDDAYLVAGSGWQAGAQPRLIVDDGDNKSKETPDFKAGNKKYVADLIPPALMIARFFADEQAKLDALETASEAVALEIEELEVEHSAEGGLLEEARADSGKFTAAASKRYATDRLRALTFEQDSDEEKEVLQRYLLLLDKAAKAGKAVKDADAALRAKVFQRYAALNEEEARQIVVQDKWLATVQRDVTAEMNRVTATLTSGVRELAEQYAQPLPELMEAMETLEKRVAAHLEKMGFSWA
ncbi:type I restriction endonuclease subunit M [Deinococcus irradiatisoli]|uniref:site-specific DNA-methyltransferase (adenine-specific) n=1 Tax=Deinococcus irradiatisoli TaxID=2202254 RepID=A0A2Z3JL48_9DEIO|nr:class I SAM-dependent DNA methyltransferase [Deinococcus irradiatisoli]AWN24271.1 type I restriction endonuclease subunit M [Deinococcus irradiatisoli]